MGEDPNATTVVEATLDEVMVRQFGKAWQMFREAVAVFDAEQWWQGEAEPLQPAWAADHTVGCTIFLLMFEELPPPPPDREIVLRDQAGLLALLDEWQPRFEQRIRSLGPDGLLAPTLSLTYTGPTHLDRLHYTLRHLHHHIGVLSAEARRRGLTPADWH